MTEMPKPQKSIEQEARREEARQISEKILVSFRQSGYEAGKAALSKFWDEHKNNLVAGRAFVYLVLSDVLSEVETDFDLRESGDEMTSNERYAKLRNMRDLLEMSLSYYEAIEQSDERQGYAQDLISRVERGDLMVYILALDGVIADAEQHRLRNLLARTLGRVRRRK